MSFALSGSEFIVRRLLEHGTFRERAQERNVCKMFQAAIDRSIELASLDRTIEHICYPPPNDRRDDEHALASPGENRLWKSPCRRDVMHGVFAEDDLDDWLAAVVPRGTCLLRFSASTLSRLLTFKYEARADDVGSCPCTVDSMLVLATTQDVDRYWREIWPGVPAALHTSVAIAQWLMRIRVKRYNFISLRAVVSCEVWREGTYEGMELVQLFFEDKIQ
eukprot:TRINITY_DN76623_c0_g1_i1.p1 TRINITY_DN76623_c0_g1~~TRINITY_DN76623_c0_g1_i1.p1  ORF type:complete len:228 (-),score=22.66 TRINITY_DN76623_c0_g1_i1:224-883(-)